jgi:predicted  nucleic acid-binding Zn ribbon protein
MLVVAKGSFYRDWQQVKNRALNKVVQEKINEIESAQFVSQISHLKKLRKFVLTSKIEVFTGSKVYWILCKISGNTITLVRLKPESYFKRVL